MSTVATMTQCIVLSRIVVKQESGVHVCVDIASYACSYVSKQMGMLMCYQEFISIARGGRESIERRIH